MEEMFVRWASILASGESRLMEGLKRTHRTPSVYEILTDRRDREKKGRPRASKRISHDFEHATRGNVVTYTSLR